MMSFKPSLLYSVNWVNELTTLALMNRVSTTTSRDISELSSIILKCKRDRVKNPLLWNDRTALRTESCVPNITPITVDSINAGIGRGNMRSEGASLYNSMDHLNEGGNLLRIPMPIRRSLTVLNSTRVTTMVRGQVVDNFGQQSPRSNPFCDDDGCVVRGQVVDNIDNFGQQSPRSNPFSTDEVCVVKDPVADSNN